MEDFNANSYIRGSGYPDIFYIEDHVKKAMYDNKIKLRLVAYNMFEDGADSGETTSVVDDIIDVPSEEEARMEYWKNPFRKGTSKATSDSMFNYCILLQKDNMDNGWVSNWFFVGEPSDLVMFRLQI